MSYNTKKSIHSRRGVAIIIAIITASIVLSLGATALNVSLKQLQFSSFAQGSVSAFYATNSAFECALLWDFNPQAPFTESVFATSSDSSGSTIPNLPPGSGIICGATDLSDFGVSSVVSTPTAATTTFTMRYSADISQPCGDVIVAKYEDGAGNTRTSVIARGLNSCDPNAPRRAERGLRVAY